MGFTELVWATVERREDCMRIHIAVALAVLTFAGCSKGSNGVTGTGSGDIVAAGGNFVNAGFAAPTILRCDLVPAVA